MDILEYINYFFTAVFTLEAIIKIIGLGFKGYFTKGWNLFDFFIVLVSYVTLIISVSVQGNFGPKQATVARAFRIGRIFRLIKKASCAEDFIFLLAVLTLSDLFKSSNLF